MPIGEIKDQIKSRLPDLNTSGIEIPRGMFDGMGSIFGEMFKEISATVKKVFNEMLKKRV